MKNGKNNKGKRRKPRHQRDNRDRKPTFTDEDIVSKEELERGNNLISLPELRTKSISELQTTAESICKSLFKTIPQSLIKFKQ